MAKALGAVEMGKGLALRAATDFMLLTLNNLPDLTRAEFAVQDLWLLTLPCLRRR